MLNRQVWMVGSATLAMALGIAVKLALTSGELLPGLDGAYYWVQVRSLIENGRLAFDDVPLVFWLQATFAFLTGDIKLGVRMSEAILPALSAIPIFLMLKNAKGIFVPAVGIFAVLLHPIQWYFFTGDFIKNEVAIPLVFFIAWVLCTWLDRSKLRSGLYVVIALALVGMSHFGTLLMSILLIGGWGLFMLRRRPFAFWLKVSLTTLVSLLAVLAILAVVVPGRFERLLAFATQPSRVFSSPLTEFIFTPVLGIIFGGKTDLVLLFTLATGQLGSVLLGIALWKLRKGMSASSLGLASSALVTAFLLSSPFVGLEWAARFIALSWVPLALAVILIWNSTDRKGIRVTLALFPISVLLCSSILAFGPMREPVLNATELRDLKNVSQTYVFPANSLVIARHGVEFLVAWEMRVKVAQDSFANDVVFGDYEAVYSLEQKVADEQGQKSGDVASQGNVVYQNESFVLIRLR